MTTHSLLIEVYEAVLNINENIHVSLDRQGSSTVFYPLVLNTDGMSVGVDFLGVRIWDDNTDSREFLEDRNDYEPLEPFLRKTIMAELEIMKKIKL